MTAVRPKSALLKATAAKEAGVQRTPAAAPKADAMLNHYADRKRQVIAAMKDRGYYGGHLDTDIAAPGEEPTQLQQMSPEVAAMPSKSPEESAARAKAKSQLALAEQQATPQQAAAGAGGVSNASTTNAPKQQPQGQAQGEVSPPQQMPEAKEPEANRPPVQRPQPQPPRQTRPMPDDQLKAMKEPSTGIRIPPTGIGVQ